MSVLDDADSWPVVDPKSMRTLLVSFPSQVRAAVDEGKSVSLSPVGELENVVVTGLGGSAIGGDVIRSVVGQMLRVPLIINRDYGLPGFVNASTLVIASSYSGNTEETLSAFEEAKRQKAAIICITTGGQLAARARSNGYPVITISPGLPPRVALGYSSIALLSVLRALNLIPDMNGPLEETVSLLFSLVQRYRPEVPETNNRAKEIARSLHGKVVAVYGSSGILDAAAARWRGQIEENAKNLSFHHLLPEMNHNELVGWKYPAEVLHRLGVVFLRDKGDHPQVQRRFEFAQDLIRGKAGVVQEVWTQGDSPLARVFSAIYLGDFVSLYMAYLNTVDPTPVEVIDLLKQKLSE